MPNPSPQHDDDDPKGEGSQPKGAVVPVSTGGPSEQTITAIIDDLKRQNNDMSEAQVKELELEIKVFGDGGATVQEVEE